MNNAKEKNELSKRELFESAPVPKAIATMAVPTIISQLINLIYNMVDTIFIGRTGDAYKTAAVTIAFTVFMMTVSFSNLFGIGGGSLIARLIGSGKTENAKHVAAFSFYGSVVIALLYSLLIGMLMNPILYLLGASENTIEFARQYVFYVVIIGNLPVILSMTCAHLLRNAGYSKIASLGLSGGGILNIILDPIFMFVIFPKGLEVTGAAVATLIANIVSAAYLIYKIVRLSKSTPLSLKFKDAKAIGKSEAAALFSVGIPSAILTGLFDLANVFLNSLMSVHGDLQLAAIGIVMRAERLPNAVNLGLCQGMLPIIAFNYASGNHSRMNEVVRTARKYGLLISFFSIALFLLLASPIVNLFLSTSAGDAKLASATIAFAAVFLRIRCLASPLQFLNYHTSFCLQAVGEGRYTLLHSVFRELVFYIPFMFILNHFFGTLGLVSALIFGEGAGALFAIFLLRKWNKKNLLLDS